MNDNQEWKDLGPADLAPGQHRGIKLGPEEFVLLTNLEGTYHAIDDWCNHAGCLLSKGPLEGELIVCPCHYAEFNVKSGELASLPRICEDQARYELRIEDGKVMGKRLPEPEPR
jgi:3-phenylpropionate/trans-cinnamate dioxygenase ferredoxin component